jgi:hypothetical protein
MGRVYKLLSTGVTTTNGSASLRIAKRCRVRCIVFSLVGTAGAAVDGRLSVEVSKQNTSSLSINDTPETVMASASLAGTINAGVASTHLPIICDIQMEQGETVYLNLALIGTSFSSTLLSVYLYTDT